MHSIKINWLGLFKICEFCKISIWEHKKSENLAEFYFIYWSLLLLFWDLNSDKT